MNSTELKFGSLLAADFTFVEVSEVGISDESPFPLPVGALVQLTRLHAGEIILSWGNGRQASLAATRSEGLRLIDAVEASGGAGLCWAVASGQKSVRLQAHLFTRLLYFPESSPLAILVGERIQYELPEAHRNNPLAFLQRTFLLDDMAFALTGKPEGNQGFRLLGNRYYCDIEVDGGRFECARFGPLRQQPDRPVTLLKGIIVFGDGSFALRNEAFLRTNLSERLLRPDSYLTHWEIYNELEATEYLMRAAEIGEARYSSWSRRSKEDSWEYTFFLASAAPSSFRKLDIELEADDSSRAESDEDMTDRGIPKKSDGLWNPALASINQAPNKTVGEIVRVSMDGMRVTTLSPNQSSWKPPSSGYLAPSIRGDEVRLSRRRTALEQVRSGQTPLLTLAALLEEGKAPVTRFRVEQALTEASREALGHDPTPSQREALNVALNTPDIAIVQGPPGTGKTSVIRALVRRLAELSENRGDNADILVTSYQHDAIENAMGGFDIMGLPTHRIGGKRGISEEERDASLHEWIRLRQDGCDQNLRQMEGSPVRQVARDIDLLIRQWKQVRGSEEGVQLLLQEILQRAGTYLSPDLMRKLMRAVETFSASAEGISDAGTNAIPVDDTRDLLWTRLKEHVSQQRLTVEAFLEDGPGQARRLIRFLQGAGQELMGELPDGLERAASLDLDITERAEIEEVVADLQAVITRFIQTFSTSGEASDSQSPDIDPMVALDEILQEVSLSLRQHKKSEADAVAEAVLAFREDLDDTEQVREMIARYSAVVAGTCQQIAGRRMLTGRTRYRVVIVDEAARANPLDLLIPMARGERVILVGDHKQLPHILESEVVATYRKTHSEEMTERLKISLFERLYRLFEEEQRRGGPRRVVTLLDDFRMHPVISQFVSDQFYREEGVRPGRRIEDRLHGLGMYGDKPVAWIDAPAALGQETPGRSKSRLVEVTIAMREVEQVLQANHDPAFRVGVITFYEQQAQLLEVARQRLPQEWKERVLVGTVDAFQGLEFDVIFLSTVRCNQRSAVRDRVGFLALENRLCVALSRAKRLLVLVGDVETVTGPGEDPSIPALHAFYTLCQSGEGWYEQRT